MLSYIDTCYSTIINIADLRWYTLQSFVNKHC